MRSSLSVTVHYEESDTIRLGFQRGRRHLVDVVEPLEAPDRQHADVMVDGTLKRAVSGRMTASEILSV